MDQTIHFSSKYIKKKRALKIKFRARFLLIHLFSHLGFLIKAPIATKTQIIFTAIDG